MTEKEKLDKLVAEIERRYNYHKDHADDYFWKANEDRELLSFIDSMQKEPVNEDLVSVAEEYAKTHSVLLGFDCDSEPIETGVDIKKAVIYGAKWQKQQLVKVAVEIPIVMVDKTPAVAFSLPDTGLKEGDKIKVIVFKS